MSSSEEEAVIGGKSDVRRCVCCMFASSTCTWVGRWLVGWDARVGEKLRGVSVILVRGDDMGMAGESGRRDTCCGVFKRGDRTLCAVRAQSLPTYSLLPQLKVVGMGTGGGCCHSLLL